MDEQSYEAFFHQMYDSCHQAVFAYIYARVGQRELAKDLLQEVFLRAWKQIHTGYEMGAERCRFWLFRITKNLITDHFRKNNTTNQTVHMLRQDALVRAEFGRSPEEEYESKNNVNQIEKAIGRLPENLRSVLVLHLLGGLNSVEIGELLEIPAGTIRYRISMARKRVMRELNDKKTMKEGHKLEQFQAE